MKFRVTMKDPDGVYDSLDEAAKEAADAVQGIDDDERESVQEMKREKLAEFAGKWLEYGEYAEIEFDTEAGTAVLVKRNG